MGRGGHRSRGPRACSLTASARSHLANQGEWPRRGTESFLATKLTASVGSQRSGKAVCLAGIGGRLRPREDLGASKGK